MFMPSYSLSCLFVFFLNEEWNNFSCLASRLSSASMLTLPELKQINKAGWQKRKLPHIANANIIYLRVASKTQTSLNKLKPPKQAKGWTKVVLRFGI